jgi:hypothetical protein
MRKGKLLNALRKFSFYIPFTWYFVLFSVAAGLGYLWLQRKSEIPDSAYKDIFLLLLVVALWCALIVLSTGWLSVTVPYFYFRWRKKRGDVSFSVNVEADPKEKGEQPVSVFLRPVLRPLLGFIRIRLNYDENLFSEKFSLSGPSGKLFGKSIEGVYHWKLPGIREYRINKAYIYFEDFFQFFSFAASIDAGNSFHAKPVNQNISRINAFPRKTEETNTRIEELKKVEGELISYKNFESNDDVRRIVWKIYAKNKELVVRIPEILDPYASHIYFYPSYHNIFDTSGNEVVNLHFLNFYKNLCWSVFNQLASKGLEVRYIPDQLIPPAASSNAGEIVKHAVTLSDWQKQNELKSFVKAKDASVIMISSLNDVKEVEELVERFGNDIAFIFVPLTESLKSQSMAHWLRWVFVQEEKDDIAVYRAKWSISAVRYAIVENEKAIKKLLKQFHKSEVLEGKGE